MPRPGPATRELRQVSTAFRMLARAFRTFGSVLAAAESQNGASSRGTRQRRKPRLTAEWRLALKLQGKYMGTMRGLKPRQRAQVKKVRATKGVRAAIAAAKRLAG